MDLNELLIFIKVVELQSFTAAGQVLGLQKSTISRKLAQLEERLGVRLLNRTTRKLSLTDIGQSHYQRCREILNELEEAELAVARTQDEPSGILRISMPTEFGQVLMGRFIAEFMQRYPKLQVQAELSTRLVDLVGESFDLAIRVNRLEDSSLVCRKLLSIPLKLYASRAYLDQYGSPSHPDDLQQHRLLCVHKDTLLQQSWQLYKENSEYQVHIKAALSANSLAFCKEAMLAGLGITRLPVAYMQDVPDQVATSILDDWRFESASIWAVYPSRRFMPVKLRVFLDELVAHLDMLRQNKDGTTHQIDLVS